MARERRAATLQDVADRVGVATSTVSRYLSNPSIVAEATRERIQAAIEEVGYIPNSAAASLALKRSKVIALLVPQFANTLFDTTIDLITTELHDDGYTVLLGLTGWDLDRVESLVRAAISRQVEAIISGGHVPDDVRKVIERSGVTYVHIWDIPEDPIDIAIGFSHREAGTELARFVHNRGYVRPHLVTATSSRAMVRSQAFKAEWQKLMQEEPSEQTISAPSRFDQARGAFANMRRMDEMPDVVLCASDTLAQGIIVEASSAGLQVPEDIAVIGFGNAAIAGEMRPTITTVEIDGRRLAQETLQVLRERLNDDGFDKKTVDVGFTIIGRESA